jgi:hypothetical protein
MPTLCKGRDKRKLHLARTSPAASGFVHGTPSHVNEKYAKSRGTLHTGGRERTRFTKRKGEVNIARELRRLLQMVVGEEKNRAKTSVCVQEGEIKRG